MNIPFLNLKTSSKQKAALLIFGVYFSVLVSNISGIVYSDFGRGNERTDQWQVSSNLLKSLTMVGITNADDHEKSIGISFLSSFNQPNLNAWERLNPVQEKISLFIFQRYERGRSPPSAV